MDASYFFLLCCFSLFFGVGIRAVQMDNLRGLLGIRRIIRIPNVWIKELCGVMKGLMKVLSGGLAMGRGCRMIGL